MQFIIFTFENFYCIHSLLPYASPLKNHTVVKHNPTFVAYNFMFNYISLSYLRNCFTNKASYIRLYKP